MTWGSLFRLLRVDLFDPKVGLVTSARSDQSGITPPIKVYISVSPLKNQPVKLGVDDKTPVYGEAPGTSR